MLPPTWQIAEGGRLAEGANSKTATEDLRHAYNEFGNLHYNGPEPSDGVEHSGEVVPTFDIFRALADKGDAPAFSSCDAGRENNGGERSFNAVDCSDLVDQLIEFGDRWRGDDCDQVKRTTY